MVLDRQTRLELGSPCQGLVTATPRCSDADCYQSCHCGDVRGALVVRVQVAGHTLPDERLMTVDVGSTLAVGHHTRIRWVTRLTGMIVSSVIAGHGASDEETPQEGDRRSLPSGDSCLPVAVPH